VAALARRGKDLHAGEVLECLRCACLRPWERDSRATTKAPKPAQRSERVALVVRRTQSNRTCHARQHVPQEVVQARVALDEG
jgi:hypothetical protein